MEELWSGATLFEAMARSRAEWLAQGMLIRAIQHEPALQRHLAARVGAQRPGHFKLLSESRKDESGSKSGGAWRPDLRIEWDGPQGTPKRALEIELKLWAPLSEAQQNALGRDGTLLIGPRKYAKEYPTLHVATWREIAVHVKLERITRKLLEQIDDYARGWFRRLEWKKVDSEYASFEKSAGGRWPSLYRFLATIDEHLRVLAPDRYDPSAQFAVKRKPESSVRSYYGYYFSMKKNAHLKQYWIGFFRDGETVRFAVQRRPAPSDGYAWKDVGPKVGRGLALDAEAIAKSVAKLGG